MKKNIKNRILSNVIVAIIVFLFTFTFGAVAVTMFSSSEVSYDNSNSGAEATTVEEALDEIYTKRAMYNPYAVGTPIYYNPVSGAKCFDYVSDNSLNENVGETTDTQCMKWYIIGEDTDTIDMILDHNTTYASDWVKSDDYGVMVSTEVENSKGPLTLLKELHTATDAWIGVPVRTDTYTDPLKGYEINYSGYRARLIEANEIARITGADKALGWDSATATTAYYLDGKYGTDSTWRTQVATSQGASKYAWLFDFLVYDYSSGFTSGIKPCTEYGCYIVDTNAPTNSNNGYWTISASAFSSSYALVVSARGMLSNESIVSNDTGSLNSVVKSGLRPVITIPKP